MYMIKRPNLDTRPAIRHDYANEAIKLITVLFWCTW